jgi:hypothetical protein
MKTPRGSSKPKRHRKRLGTPSPGEGVSPTTGDSEPTSRRLHGDSYADVISREDELGATTSTHVERPDRRIEEPSEPPLGAPERLEDSA